MSQFSGKCDFYDGFVEIYSNGDEEKLKEELKKLKLYIRGNDNRNHLVKTDTIKDIAKYYPYLEAIAYSSDDRFIVVLSADSFIDYEEKERLSYRIEDVLKYWRKCKRKKMPFTKEEFYKDNWWTNEALMDEIIDRVAKYGDKAEFDDIHLPMHEYYRKRWFEELVRLGYTKREAYDWVYKGLFDSPEVIEKRLGRKLEE